MRQAIQSTSGNSGGPRISPEKRNKRRRPNGVRESDVGVVPMIAGNAAGGKVNTSRVYSY